jgi:hypothetical protein
MKNILFLLILTLAILQSCNHNIISGDENTNKPDEQDTTTVLPPSNPEDYFQMEEDPEAKAAIIGKWTKIAHGVDEDHIQWFEAKAKDYPIIEFLKNGEWKCYAAYASLPDETIYRYMISKTHIIRYPHSKDESFHVTEYRFIDKDRLKIKHIYGPISESMGTPFVYIYKRFLN